MQGPEGRVAGKLDAQRGRADRAGGGPGPGSSGRQAKELYDYLAVSSPHARSPRPRCIAARLATPLRARGTDARVECEIANVPEVTITVGGGAPMTVPRRRAAAPQLHAFPARESGPVTLEAKNRYDAVRVDLGELKLYEIPPFDPKSIHRCAAEVAVPPLEAFTLDALAPALATVPRVAVPELPRLPVDADRRPHRLLRRNAADPDLRSAAAPRSRTSLRLPDFSSWSPGRRGRSPSS